MQWKSLFLAIAGAAAATAIPLAEPDTLIVWVPKILTPTANTTWTIGQQVTVTWDTSAAPSPGDARPGQILLGHETGPDFYDYTIDQENPLATDFPLSGGSVTFELPENTTVSDKSLIVLLGDSGNRSPTFTINAA